MAFTAIAAMATGGGAAALGISAFTAMSYVGVAMAVVGVVTKDQQLMKTGSLLGMAGGIGGALTSTGTTAAAGATMTGGEVAGEAAAGDALAGVSAADGAAMAESQLASKAAASAAESAAGGMQAMGSGGLATAPVAAPPGAPMVTPEIMPVGASETATAGISGPGGLADPAAAFDPLAESAGKASAGDFFSGVGKFWDKLGPQGQASAIQLAGGALKGASDTEMWNEKMAMENRRTDLVSHGSEVARYRPGLINSAKA